MQWGKWGKLADGTAIYTACINESPNVSGLKMNVDKSVLFPIKSCSLSDCIPIEEKMTCLGIVICKNVEQ